MQMSPWEKSIFLENLKVFVAVSKKIEARLSKNKKKKLRGKA